MLRRLSESGLVKYAAHQGVRLTKKGQSAAIRVVRNHRLLESFLTRTLGLPWDEVHAEAESLEHAVSDRLVARIDEYLGHPDRDPHDNVIGAKDLAMDRDRHEVRRGGKDIQLTAKEYALLEYLLLHRNKVQTRDELYDVLGYLHYEQKLDELYPSDTSGESP